MPTVEELRAKCIEQLAALKAEEALSRDISRVIKVAQIRQQVYSNALPAARAGARVENLEWWSRTVKIVAVTAVGVAVAAYAAPIATAYLAQTSGTALSWLSSNVTITATIAGKTATVATVSAGTLAIGAALSPTTGLKWPVFARKAQGPLGFPFLLENHARRVRPLLGFSSSGIAAPKSPQPSMR